jgi:hypothetical protein
MEDVFGEKMTDARISDIIKENGDILTCFVPTKSDLISLAHKLVDEYLDFDFRLRLNVSLSWIDRQNYTSFRLSRVMELLPELDAEIEKEMRLGLENNEAAAEEGIAEWAATHSTANENSSTT